MKFNDERTDQLIAKTLCSPGFWNTLERLKLYNSETYPIQTPAATMQTFAPESIDEYSSRITFRNDLTRYLYYNQAMLIARSINIGGIITYIFLKDVKKEHATVFQISGIAYDENTNMTTVQFMNYHNSNSYMNSVGSNNITRDLKMIFMDLNLAEALV